jgi:hypothetical protein
MRRLAPLALVMLLGSLVGGCRPDADHTAPDGSIAGTETKHDRSASAKSTAAAAASSGSAKSLTRVTATSVDEAEPCERMCGSLGDCLFVDDAYTTVAASGLELQCLDLCVHAPDTEPAKTDFLACGNQTACGQLQACAERTWDALASVRRGHGPTIASVVTNVDPCKDGCRWVYSCLITGSPPGEAQVDEYIQKEINACLSRCEGDEITDADLESWIKMAECLPNHCTSVDDAYTCIYNH